MKTDSNQELLIKNSSVLIFSTLGALELALAAMYLLIKEGQHTGEFLFGLAAHGVVEITLTLLLAAAFLLFFISTLKNRQHMTAALRGFVERRQKLLLVITLLGLVLGWGIFTIPPDFFGRFSGYYQWLRPLPAVFGLIALQGSALFLKDSGKISTFSAPFQVIKSKVFIIILAGALLVFAGSYASGFGVISDTALWNVPGVPISGTQMFFVGLVFGGLFLCEGISPRFRELVSRRRVQVGILLLVFLGALFIWGATPLRGDSLALEPSLANPEPYPRRDARVHDLGALSILYGTGINFRGYTDKPLYMVLLAIFHLVAGYDYKLLEWVQITFLAWIPVMAYLLGRHFHSSIFGMLVAALVILQQRNAIVLSRMISSVNVKILVTETFVLMGVILLVLLLVRWNDNHDRRTLLLAGGVIGALSLIRLNPLLFLPFIVMFIIIHYWKKKVLILPRLLIFAAGFLIMFLPWLLTGTNIQGQSFVIQKFQDVFNTRIAPLMHLPGIPAETVLADSQEGTLQVSYSVNQETAAPSGLKAASTAKTADMSEPVAAGGANYLKMVAAHFVHNYIAAILPMPDTLSRNSISVLAERDYWADSRIWDGKLSSGLLRFIVLNLVLISLGAAYSWKKQGWRGLIPLAVFLVYDLAVSVSLTSGGRYIVPINWIVFFYYAMGLVFLLDTCVGLFRPNAAVVVQGAAERSPENRGKLLPALMGLFLFAMLIPAANLLVPRLVPHDPAENAAALFSALGPERQTGSQYFSGTVLYPTYIQGGAQAFFTFYRGYKVNELSVWLYQPQQTTTRMNTRLQSGDPVMLVYEQQDQLTGIYIYRENLLQQYWKFDNSGNTP